MVGPTAALTKRQTDRQSERERRKIMEADGRIETDRREDKQGPAGQRCVHEAHIKHMKHIRHI